jgi:hypothetical protein
MRELLGLLAIFLGLNAAAEGLWVVNPAGTGPGAQKRVVLVSGDEEYRSEEMLPQFAKILSTRHGFETTVLFAINPDGNYIDATCTKNIPGLATLDNADLMVIFTRFRDLPDAQMAHVDRFLMAGKPVIGIRTSTHAFKPGNATWAHYGDGYNGDKAEWKDGFGRLVLGEHWISHHGAHKGESTVGLIVPAAVGNPILRGLKNGDIWGSTDVYGVRLPLPEGSVPLVLGQVTKRVGAYSGDDLHYGMRPTDAEPVTGAKNDPMMPVVWTKPYQLPGGTPGQALSSTVGSGADFTNAGVRRVLVNAVYVLCGLGDALPAEGAAVDLVGDYAPTKYEFRTAEYWKERNLKPGDLR